MKTGWMSTIRALLSNLNTRSAATPLSTLNILSSITIVKMKASLNTRNVKAELFSFKWTVG